MIDAHRGAFEYDWRSRFHKPLRSVGKSMTWGEAVRLASLLARDPSSQVCAALLRWEHPITRADMTLRDLYDLTQAPLLKKPKPYPRPWPRDNVRRIGTARMSSAQLRLVLDKHRAEVTDG